MKIYKVLITTLLLGSIMLTGCAKTEEPTPEPADEGRADFNQMTEEERTEYMIKLIEAEEARIKSAEEAE